MKEKTKKAFEELDKATDELKSALVDWVSPVIFNKWVQIVSCIAWVGIIIYIIVCEIKGIDA